MKFCPTCEVRLKKSESGLKCPKCNYSEGDTSSTKKIEEKEVSEFNVLEESEGKETLPSIKIDCEKCGNNEAVWWMLQTRSADEPTTQFYRCTKCNYTWRNYA
ncbi:MAG TPA: transcription factor S [Nitrosarchaeum sp.]|nr:transcription factor S [Nitrosarchaeum sp.]